MREILFRGKRKDNGEWVEGLPFFEENRCYIIEDLFICDEYQCTGAVNSSVIPETVGQYSGKDDANGEKMFEGDIVKGLFLHGSSILSVVTLKDGAFGLEWYRGTIKVFSAFTSICNVTYEKIGSIHDKPDLLKEGVDNG